MVRTKRSIDDEALERALQQACVRQKESNVPRRDGKTQLESMLASRSRREVSEFAAYGLQMDNLQLRPWSFPPCWISLADKNPEHAGGVALLKRLLANNLSKYEPDPLGALAAIEGPSAA